VKSSSNEEGFNALTEWIQFFGNALGQNSKLSLKKMQQTGSLNSKPKTEVFNYRGTKKYLNFAKTVYYKLEPAFTLLKKVLSVTDITLRDGQFWDQSDTKINVTDIGDKCMEIIDSLSERTKDSGQSFVISIGHDHLRVIEVGSNYKISQQGGPGSTNEKTMDLDGLTNVLKEFSLSEDQIYEKYKLPNSETTNGEITILHRLLPLMKHLNGEILLRADHKKEYTRALRIFRANEIKKEGDNVKICWEDRHEVLSMGQFNQKYLEYYVNKLQQKPDYKARIATLLGVERKHETVAKVKKFMRDHACSKTNGNFLYHNSYDDILDHLETNETFLKPENVMKIIENFHQKKITSSNPRTIKTSLPMDTGGYSVLWFFGFGI
ncbi:MAG: hypothetical protein VW397_04040, partial [Candidatus Margulisiibacteriota bacterium]